MSRAIRLQAIPRPEIDHQKVAEALLRFVSSQEQRPQESPEVLPPAREVVRHG